MTLDRTSNMLSIIKNASLAKRAFVEISYTKECEEIAKILKEKGFIENIKVFKESGKMYKQIRLDLKFEGSEPRISEIKRISKPGRRIYKKASDIKKVIGGFGIAILSTSRGIMEGSEARKKKLGGEIICEVF